MNLDKLRNILKVVQEIIQAAVTIVDKVDGIFNRKDKEEKQPDFSKAVDSEADFEVVNEDSKQDEKET